MTNYPIVADARKAASMRGLTLRTIALIAILALALPLARVAIFHSSRPYFGQATCIRTAPVALASGQGYTEPHGLWLGRPTVVRPPLWPFALSLPMRLCLWMRSSSPLP